MLKLGDLFDAIERLAVEVLESSADRAARREAVAAAWETHAARPEQLAERAQLAHTSWLVAAVRDDPAAVFDPPEPALEHRVVATDGSQIFPDRHGPANCFLINLGLVNLRYGETSTAHLNSTPTLFADEARVYHDTVGQRQAVGSEEVGALRGVMEFESLLELARAAPDNTVAIADGTLICWGWLVHSTPEPDDWREDLLERHFAALDGFADRGVPVASYISRSGAGDVINLVRIADCDQEPVNCDRCPHLAALSADGRRRSLTAEEARTLPCGTPAGLCDADLFGQRLRPGQRSAVFSTRSSVYHNRPETQRVAFFYVRVGDEIARVEMPGRIADDPEHVARLHAVIVDQARKGRGYPVALREAHEQAVVRAADRQAFERLLERSLVRRGAAVRHSAKQRSKNQPGA